MVNPFIRSPYGAGRLYANSLSVKWPSPKAFAPGE